MKFINTHRHVAQLKEEHDRFLKIYAGSICGSLITNKVLNDIERDVTVEFDEYNAPEVESTICQLKDLARRLYKKYKNKKGDNKNGNFICVLTQICELNEDNINEDNIDVNDNILPRSIVDLVLQRDEQMNCGNNKLKDDIEMLKGALLNAHHGYKIAGIYNHTERKITLFTKNIGNNYEDYCSVFCHEYFHAIHHYLLDLYYPHVRLDRYVHEVLLESLATYFQIEYLNRRGFHRKAADEKSQIMKHSPIFYPYSGCQGFFNHTKAVFCNVFKVTMSDFEKALYMLVSNSEAEIILKKNSKRILCPLGTGIKDKIFEFFYELAMRVATSQKAYTGPRNWMYDCNQFHSSTSALKKLVDEVFAGGITNQTDYDAKFLDVSIKLCDEINADPRAVPGEFTFGNAQKLINVMMKYFYGTTYTNVALRLNFKYCHCPMDRVLLEHVWDNRKYLTFLLGFKKDFVISWSKQDFDYISGVKVMPGHYETFQNAVRELGIFAPICPTLLGTTILNPLMPIEYDFYAW